MREPAKPGYNPTLQKMRDRNKTGTAYKHSRVQEKKLAQKTHAWRVPGSGSGKKKGDVQVKGIARIECKCTQRKSFSVTREMLQKIEDASGATGEIPIVQVEFLDKAGKIDGSFAVVPMYVLERLIADVEE